MDYPLLISQAESLLDQNDWYITTLSNAAALLYNSMPDINWAGFYLMKDGELQLGPFQGKPACTHIAISRGVCGTAVAEDQVQLVADVHAFPGHIACDSASNSEIVIPMHRNGKIWGVLDIDSPVTKRFTEEDSVYLQKIVHILERKLSE